MCFSSVSMNVAVFWSVTPCILYICIKLRGIASQKTPIFVVNYVLTSDIKENIWVSDWDFRTLIIFKSNLCYDDKMNQLWFY